MTLTATSRRREWCPGEDLNLHLSRNRYDAAICIQEYIDFKLQGGQSGTSDVTEARTALYLAQTHKVELENDRTRSETVSADDHLADMLAFQRIIDEALEGAPERMAESLVGLKDANVVQARLLQATNAPSGRLWPTISWLMRRRLNREDR